MVTANKKNAILERWGNTLARRQDAVAVYAPDGSPIRTFSSIEEEAASLGVLFSKFPPGVVVAIRAGNSPVWPAILLAAFRRGVVPLPAGRHMEENEFDIAMRACGVAGVVEIRSTGVVADAVTGAEWRYCGEEAEFLKLTSGTTAAPRAVAFSSAQLLADCDNVCDTMGIQEEDVNFGVIPFSHSYGFSNLITPLLGRGVSLVASEDRMPRAILNDLARSGATVFPGMPVFYQAFTAMPDLPDLPSLRLCISAGAPLPVKTAAAFTGRMGLKIHTFYGSSECGGIAYDRGENGEYEDSYLGTPMERVTLEFSEGENPGRIRVRSAAVGNGYVPGDAESSQLSGGTFYPQDLIRSSGKGLYLAGRVTDIINVAGRKLNPLEVEAQIQQIPGVRQAVVFGVPSRLRNEEPVACVVLEEGVELSFLKERCREVLSPWQVPKDLWQVQEIPVNERGKVVRRNLADAYSAR